MRKQATGIAPVDDARMRKDATEIELLRRASRINDTVVAAGIAALAALVVVAAATAGAFALRRRRNASE